MSRRISTTRRQFLQQATAAGAAAMGFPTIIPSSALGLDGATAPSQRIVMGCIGMGGKGRNNMQTFLSQKDVQVVAVCDVDKKHLGMGEELVNKHYNNKGCATFRDFRELVVRQDLDAVSVATPDHWHAITSVAALNCGKDVYCEKPLANSVGEGRAICDAAYANCRIVQCGSHERSGDNARYACELVRNGRIGKLHTIRINLPNDDAHHKQARELSGAVTAQPVPENLDYDFWLGHTAAVSYHEKRVHFWWRFNLAYGGGEMTDRGAHVIDIGQLGAGMDDTGPVEYEATGVANKGGLYNVFWDYKFVNTYANGLKMIGEAKGPRGLKFEGTDGWIFVHIHGGKLEASSDSLLTSKIGANEIQLGRSPGHHRNFLDSVKSRVQPVATAEIGHRTASICHLNNIAMTLGRKLTWNPCCEQVVNDCEANRLLTPDMRWPWSV